MSFWQSFWGWTLIVVLGIYALLVIGVAIGGFGDLRRLWGHERAPNDVLDERVTGNRADR